MSSLFEVISNAWKSFKNYIIVFCAAFVLGCVLSGTIMYKINRVQSGQYRQSIEQFRGAAESAETSNKQLRDTLNTERKDYQRLAKSIEQQRELIQQFNKTISDNGNSISSIRKSVQEIRKICKAMEDNIGDSDTCNSGSNDSFNSKN